MRPFTLRDVSERIANGADATKEFSEFLDHFYDKKTHFGMIACLQDEPSLLPEKRWNAIFGATAEYLSKRYRLSSVPEWAGGADRYLDEPWFAETSPELREYLTFQSPAEFRSRNLYVEAVPLRRARTWQAEERLRERMSQTWERENEAMKLKMG